MAYDVFAESAAGAPFVKYKRDAYLQPDETPIAFSLDLVAKDLSLILELAERHGVEMPQGHANLGLVRSAIDAGFGPHDMSAIAGFLREG